MYVLRVFNCHRMALCIAVITTTALITGLLCSAALRPTLTSGERPAIALSPDPVMLGTLDGRRLVERVDSARNTQNAPIKLARIETSCPCIQVTPRSRHIAADEAQDWTVTFDPSPDPGFEGRLSVEVTGYLEDGQIAFRTHVDLEMKPKPDRRRE
jgi:hypothetical protein